jgi:hypothetical protein
VNRAHFCWVLSPKSEWDAIPGAEAAEKCKSRKKRRPRLPITSNLLTSTGRRSSKSEFVELSDGLGADNGNEPSGPPRIVQVRPSLEVDSYHESMKAALGVDSPGCAEVGAMRTDVVDSGWPFHEDFAIVRRRASERAHSDESRAQLFYCQFWILDPRATTTPRVPKPALSWMFRPRTSRGMTGPRRRAPR